MFNDKDKAIITAMNVVRNELKMFPEWQYAKIKLRDGDVWVSPMRVWFEKDDFEIGFSVGDDEVVIQHYTHRRLRAVLHIFDPHTGSDEIKIPHDTIEQIYILAPNEIDLEILFDSRDW